MFGIFLSYLLCWTPWYFLYATNVIFYGDCCSWCSVWGSDSQVVQRRPFTQGEDDVFRTNEAICWVAAECWRKSALISAPVSPACNQSTVGVFLFWLLIEVMYTELLQKFLRSRQQRFRLFVSKYWTRLIYFGGQARQSYFFPLVVIITAVFAL